MSFLMFGCFSSFQLLPLVPVHDGVFTSSLNWLETASTDGRSVLRLPDLFPGVLGKSSGQGIRVPTLEKDQVLGWGAAAVLLHRIVHAVFPRDLLKLLDGGVGDLDVGNALILADQLFHRLLAVGNHGGIPAFLLLQLLFLAVGKVLGDGGFHQPPGKLCSA